MFMVVLKDKQKDLLTQDLLAGHIEFLRSLNSGGQLIVCGPFVDNDRGLLILQCESLTAAERIVQSDPFVAKGYYRSFTISEFVQANDNNNWLMDT